MTQPTVPCPTCYNQISPLDPSWWAYLKDVPSDGNYAAELCAGARGDAYQGIITNRCDVIRTVPVSSRGYKYVDFRSEDCGQSSSTDTCMGSQVYGLGECAGDAYGACVAGSHRWYLRDWTKELPTPDDQLACCLQTPPATPGRTQWCPTDLWFGSQRCQNLISSTATFINSGPGSNFDQYINLNLTQAGGMNPEPLFSAMINQWASAIGNRPLSPTDPMLGLILKYQSSFPAVVGPALEQACQSTSGQDVLADSTGTIGKVCGCFLPSTEYYLDGIIPRQCQAMCQIQSSIGGVPLYLRTTTGGYAPEVCTQSTCVMDDVTVSFINSVAPNLNFSQICGQCSANGACTCIAQGITIATASSTIPNADLSQNCTAGPVPPGPPRPSGGVPTWVWWVAGGLIVGACGWLFYRSRARE